MFLVFVPVDPPWVRLETPSTVTEGDNVTLKCDANDGNPPPIEIYHWQFCPSYADIEIPVIKCNASLCQLGQVGLQRSGEYVCTAFNGNYKTSDSSNITVMLQVVGEYVLIHVIVAKKCKLSNPSFSDSHGYPQLSMTRMEGPSVKKKRGEI